MLIDALTDDAVVHHRPTQKIQRPLRLPAEQAVGHTQHPGMGGVGAADFRKGAPGEAVRILRGADLTHCILICGVIRRAEAQVGQEQQASWRLVIYICMALQIRGPGIVWAVRALDNTVLQDPTEAGQTYTQIGY